MSQFSIFAKAVKAQFDDLVASGAELFVVDVTGDEVWSKYLASFPEGTNPVFRERTQHDCSCCRHFIRNIGNVVVQRDGQLASVWGDLATYWSDPDVAPGPYLEVAAALAELVESASISGLYRTFKNFVHFGKEYNTEQLANGDSLTWHHFHGSVPARVVEASPASVIGEYATSVQVMTRGFQEISASALDVVIELIESDNLYRGAEFLPAVTEFRDQQREYSELTDPRAKHLFLWSRAGRGFARFRGTMIGSLLVDISEGKNLDGAVASYEAKAAPENYKRPKSIITQSMVDDAMKTIDKLGIEPALVRRHAQLGDVNVNNVIWVNNSAQGQMRGALHETLSKAVVKEAPSSDKATDIRIEDFMASVLPGASDIQLSLRNNQQGRLMTITTAQDESAPLVFKWPNRFAWSYNGNITDSAIRAQVQAKGGRVDGVLRFSHSWNYDKRNASLMDLHVFMPGCEHSSGQHDEYGTPRGQRVGWNQRKDAQSGGIQDVDYVEAAPVGYVPVENITFPDLARLKDGQYQCKIHNWNNRQPTEGGFRAEIEFEGQVFEYEYDKPLRHKEWIDVATVTLKDGKFSIVHHLPPTSVSQAAWGIETQTFVKVDTVMFSPNHWDGHAVGNKHWFFLINGCKNPDPVRGIYNEYLDSKLDKHRKVFEILGSRTMCTAPVDEPQLSGVGFSSTQRDSLLVQATSGNSRRLYNIQF